MGGLLAVVAGLALLTGMIWQLVQMGGLVSFAIEIFPFQLALGLEGLAVMLLIAGGALLCLRVGFGRFLIPVGAVVLLVHLGLTVADVNGFISTVAVFHAFGLQDVVMLTILLSLVSSLLGLLPSTARWVSTLRT